MIAVALAYHPDGVWTWSKGRQEHRQGIEYWNTGELQEASTGITLQYGSGSNPCAQAEYGSAETTYLMLPDEEYDPQTRQVREPRTYTVPDASASDDSLENLDEMLF